MNSKLDWVYANIQKIKDFEAAVENKFTKLELMNTTPEQAVERNTFNEVDMTPRQAEGMDTADEGLATSPRQQHCNLLGAGSKGDCFVFDRLKSRIAQPEKEIYRKDEIIIFLMEQLSVSNVNTCTISSNYLRN